MSHKVGESRHPNNTQSYHVCTHQYTNREPSTKKRKTISTNGDMYYLKYSPQSSGESHFENIHFKQNGGINTLQGSTKESNETYRKRRRSTSIGEAEITGISKQFNTRQNDEELSQKWNTLLSNEGQECTKKCSELNHIRKVPRVMSCPLLQELTDTTSIISDDISTDSGGEEVEHFLCVTKKTKMPSGDILKTESYQNTHIMRVISCPSLCLTEDDSSIASVEKDTIDVTPPPNQCHENMSPLEYTKLLIRSIMGFEPKTLPSLSISEKYFHKPTKEHIASYTVEALEAVRERNTKSIRELYLKRKSLECCNRFGESLLHNACRRGFTDIVDIFIKEAEVPVRVRDDYGRTPFHDACWNREPAFEIMDLLMKKDPYQLFLSDKRGFTPFDYARREHWGLWRSFLYERRECFNTNDRIVDLFR